MGFLYIIRNKGRTKIGITVNIRQRMKQLKPDRICQIVQVPRKGEKKLEKKLHRLFADKRLHGSEYFSLSWAEVRTACTVARQAGNIVQLPHQALHQVRVHRLSPAMTLQICGLGLAVGVAAALLTQSQPDGQPRKAPVSFTASTESFVSV